MKTKNEPVDKKWLKQMDEKYYFELDGSTYKISLREERLDVELIDDCTPLCSYLSVPEREVEELYGGISDLYLFDVARSEYLYEKAEQMFDEWHQDMKTERAKKIEAKIVKIKMLLTTSRIEFMAPRHVWDYNHRYIGKTLQIVFDCVEISISEKDLKKELKNDVALRKLFQTARKDYDRREPTGYVKIVPV